MKKYSVKKTANRTEQARAKLLSNHKVREPHEYAVHWEHEAFGELIEPFMECEFKDPVLNKWFEDLREIINDKKKHQQIIAAAIRQQELDDADYDLEKEWYVDLDALAEVFRPWAVPEELLKLAKYQNRKQTFLINSFNIDSSGMTVNTMSDSLDTKKLKLFASTGDGSSIGYWVKKSLDESPIVYMDHDLEGSKVISRNITEFYALLISAPSLDDNVVELEGFEYNISFVRADQPAFGSLKRWLARNFDIRPIKDPIRVMERAKDEFGDFEKWILRQFK